MNNMVEAMMTVDECAALLKMNRKTIYDAIKDGTFPGAQRFRGSIRISKEVLLASFAPGTLPVKQRKRSK